MKPEMHRRSLRARVVISLSVLFTALAATLPARADNMNVSPFQSMQPPAGLGGSPSLNQTQLVWGSSINMNVLSTPGAGTLTIKLEDLGWPEPLQSLRILVTDLDGIWEAHDGATSFSFFVAGPTDVFAAVFAKSSGGFGLYNLHTSFAPVPLPAAGWLLVSALGGLGLLRRRRQPAH